METLIKRSIDAIIAADNKAIKMINADIEPSVEQDRLQECLFGFITNEISEDRVDEFIHDLYVERISSEQIYNKYYAE